MKKLYKTIDEACNAPEGTFKKFIEEKHAEELAEQERLRQRIRKFRKKK